MTTGHRRQEGARHGLRHLGAEDGAHAFVAEGFGARMDEKAAWEGEDGVEVSETVPMILAALTVAPHALVLRRRPGDLGLEPDGAQVARISKRERSVPASVALRDALFWWLTAAFFLGTLPIAAIGVHLVSYLVDLGHDPAFAATATGMLGAMSVAGRVIVTFLSRRLPQPRVMACVFVLQAVALLLLPLLHDRLGVFVFVALFGLGFGVVTRATPSGAASGSRPGR